MKSMKFSYGVQFIRPKYIILQITPDKGLRNYRNIDIARTINKTYKAINKRIRLEKKKILIETSFKISYVIDIEKEKVNFYFIVPKPFKATLINQISNVWHKAEVKEVGGLQLSDNSDIYQLYYKNEDALSLKVDRKSNEPLNSILNVINIMEMGDRLTLFYNFLPADNRGFKNYYDEVMERYKNNELLEKQDYTISTIVKKLALTTAGILQSIIDVLNDFLGNQTSVKEEKSNIYKMIFNILNEKKELSLNTRYKKDSEILNTQIALISSSIDKHRRYNNAKAISNAFEQLEEDNSLKIKKLNRKLFDIYKTDIGTKINKCSAEETHNFIQLPAKGLLNEYNIEHISINEVELSEELKQGHKEIGPVSFKGIKHVAYWPDDYNLGNLPLYLLGGQNAGKTTVLKKYAQDSINLGESLICIDFIKNCELATAIEEVTPKDRLIKIDLSQDHKQSFSYNEYKFDKTDMRKMIKRVKQQAQQLKTLIDSINYNDPLSPRMSRYFNAAAVISILNNKNSLKDTIEILENYKIREDSIKFVQENYDVQAYLSSEFSALDELDEYSKPTKDTPAVKIGTKDNKIDFILDRVNILREDFSLQEMYENDSTNNINLVECMEQGKVVLILMNEGDFNTTQVKNIIVTYYISKIWVASQMRGQLHDKPGRCNVIIDEVFQAPTSLNTLKYIIPQSRKYGTKFVMSGHYLNQLKDFAETLLNCNCNFKLGNGSDEKDFNILKKFINDEWIFDDLKDMQKWSFFNIVQTSKGIENFINEPV